MWSPPPVAGGIALEELRRSRHKSDRSTHVVVVPRLFTTEWRKQLHKASDLVLTLPAGHPAWPADMHEPLTIAILFPFISHRPWQLRRTSQLVDLGNTLQEVWKSNPKSKGPLLRELWNFQGTMENLPKKHGILTVIQQALWLNSESLGLRMMREPSGERRRRMSILYVHVRAIWFWFHFSVTTAGLSIS